jgi:hypothetical protein
VTISWILAVPYYNFVNEMALPQEKVEFKLSNTSKYFQISCSCPSICLSESSSDWAKNVRMSENITSPAVRTSTIAFGYEAPPTVN